MRLREDYCTHKFVLFRLMSFVRVLNTKVIDLWHLNSFLDNKLWNSAEMLENGVSLCIIY